MGITLKDIYEQRDMLRRGEEIARAAKQAEERERLRDHFAAAAFTGLLAQGDDGSFSEESYAVAAYRWADAMLRVRDSRTADTTNHDAAPAATAAKETLARATDADGTGDTPVTDPMPKEKLAEVSDGSYQKTDENRGVGDTSRVAPPGECTEPVAWANCYPDEEMVDFRREYVEQCSDEGEVVPLYRHPPCQDFSQKTLTLTDEERHAVETAALEADAHQHTQRSATLRGLLERLG